MPYYAAGADGLIKPRFIFESLQEAACAHAASVGCGVADLIARGYTWVLRRYRIEIRDATPPADGAVVCRTWYGPHKNILSLREFSMMRRDGTVIADARSEWIALDLARERPSALDRALPQAYFDSAEETSGPFPREESHLKDAERADVERTFRVRRSELDMNRHTNHTVYLEWAEETADAAHERELVLQTIDAEYLRSVRAGSVICRAGAIEDDPLSIAHTISAPDDGAVFARARTVWKERALG